MTFYAEQEKRLVKRTAEAIQPKRLFLEINKEEFLDWRYSNSDDNEELADWIKTTLKEKGKTDISLNDIYYCSGYIPDHVIDNKKVVPKSRKTYVSKGMFEIEPEETDVIHWI